MVSLRIVSLEYYVCFPVPDLDITYSEFRNLEVRQVPVIQVFGSTESGEKTCLNVHGVFPYLYIPYDGLEASGPLSYKIALELDKCINISLGQATSNTIHVHNVVLVSGTPIYGYHEKPHQFFKIYFYNPAIVKKACSLLENGTILGKCFQPHEVHINYILQFTIDYNLHGMSFINVSHVKYRHNLDYPEYLSDISTDLILPKSLLPRSASKLEMDALASDITNAEEIRNGVGVNPGIAAIWNDERQRRREQNLDSQISFSLTQERELKPVPTSSDRLYNRRLQEKLTQDSAVCNDKTTLNKSVYPAETPDDKDICVASNTSVFDVTFQDNTLTAECLDDFNQKDQNLLDILQELKETAHVEEDSILSQQTPAPMNVTEISSDEEVDNLSNPLDQNIMKVIDDVVVNNNFDPWADSFWDDNVTVPQLDGIDDTDVGDSRSESTDNSQKSNTSIRYADEVFVNNTSIKIPPTKSLSVGTNTLILTKPKNDSTVPVITKIKILSDIPVRTNKSFYITHNIADIDESSPAIENYTPLCIDDWDYRSLKNQEDLNNVLVHDVNMGISLLDDSCQLKQDAGSSKMSYFSVRDDGEALDYEYSSGNESFKEKENVNCNIIKHLSSKKYELQLFDKIGNKGKQGTQNFVNASNRRTVRKLTGNNNDSNKHRSQSEDSHFNNNNSYEFNDKYICSRLSDTNINLSIKNLNKKLKNRLCNKNLDGADDTPTSSSNSSTDDKNNDDEKQQKKRLKHSFSPSRNKSPKNRPKSKCRISGLVKASAKGSKNKSKKKHLASTNEQETFVKKPLFLFDENSNDCIFPSVELGITLQTACKPEEEIFTSKKLEIIPSDKDVKETGQKFEKAAPLKEEVNINAKKRKRSAKKMVASIEKVDTTNVTLDSASAIKAKGQVVPSIKIVRKCDTSAVMKLQTDSYVPQKDIKTSSVNDYVILENVDNTKNVRIVSAPAKKNVRSKKRSKKIESDSSTLEVVNPEVSAVSAKYSNVKSTEHNPASETNKIMFQKNVKNIDRSKKVSNPRKNKVPFKIPPIKTFPEILESNSENSGPENRNLLIQKVARKSGQTKKELNTGSFKVSPLKIFPKVAASNSDDSVTENKVSNFQKSVMKCYRNKNSSIPKCTVATTSVESDSADSESNLKASKETLSQISQQLVTKKYRPKKSSIPSENNNINLSVPSIQSEIVLSDVTAEISFVESIEVFASNSRVSAPEENTTNLQQFVKKFHKTKKATIPSEIAISDVTVETSSVDSVLEIAATNLEVPIKENKTKNLQQFLKKKDLSKKASIQSEIALSDITVETSAGDSVLEFPARENKTKKLQRSIKKYCRFKNSAVITETLLETSNPEISGNKSHILKQPIKKLKRSQNKPISEITSNSDDSTRGNKTQIVNKYALKKKEAVVKICSNYANTENSQFSSNSEDYKNENVTQILQSPIRKRGRPKKLSITSKAKLIKNSLKKNPMSSESNQTEQKVQIFHSPVRKKGRPKKSPVQSESSSDQCASTSLVKDNLPSNVKIHDTVVASTFENLSEIIKLKKRRRPKKSPVESESWSDQCVSTSPVKDNLPSNVEIHDTVVASTFEDLSKIIKFKKRHRPKKSPVESESSSDQCVSASLVKDNLPSNVEIHDTVVASTFEDLSEIIKFKKRHRPKKSPVESESSSDQCVISSLAKDKSLSNAEVQDNIIASTFDDLSPIINVNKTVRKRGKPKKFSKQTRASNPIAENIKPPSANDEIIAANNLPENVVDSSFKDTEHLVKKLRRSKRQSFQKEPSLSEVKDKIDLPLKPEIADYLKKLNMTETHALEQLQNINVKIEDSSSTLELLSNANKVHIAKKLLEEIKVNNCDMKSNKYADFNKIPKDTSDSVISNKASSKRLRKNTSLQLKRSDCTENLENVIKPVLKEVRVNLIKIDHLANKHCKFRELRVVLERLNMEKILTEKLKATTSSNVEQASDQVQQDISKRVPTTSSYEKSIDSLENIEEPKEQKQKLRSSPKRNLGKKNNLALKYSPLPVVIKSPKKTVADQSPKRTIAPKRNVTMEKTRTKISTRNSVLTTASVKKEDSVTETVKVPGIESGPPRKKRKIMLKL